VDLQTAEALVAAQFDTTSAASDATAIRGWIHACVQDAVGRAKSRKVRRELGPTVADQWEYALPVDVVDVRMLRVDGSRPWRRCSTEQLWELQAGNGWLTRAPGAFAPSFEEVAEGGDESPQDGDSATLALWPTPTVAGLAMDALCAVLPPAIDSETADTYVLPVPEDLVRRIAVDGPIGMGFREALGRGDLAQQYEVRFEEAGVQELSRRANSRIGHGPVQLRPGG